MEPTKKAALFIGANKASPVIIGAAVMNGREGGQGAYYTLEDGRRFKLSGEDCRSLPEGFPRWKGMTDDSN